MIQLKNPSQIEQMKKAGRITGEALLVARDHIREGISTYELDSIIRKYIESCGAKPSFLGYAGFPGSACISINDEVIHGIPSKEKILREGDIVKVDVGAFYKGFHGDAARTIPVGKVDEESMRLITVTRSSFFEGIKMLKPGNRIGDIGHAVQQYVEARGYSVVRQFVGHGVGLNLHEAPEVPNFGNPGRGMRLVPGMTLAIEPMINLSGAGVRQLADGWTVVTKSGSISAHFEHTVLITETGVKILTVH